MDGDDEGRGKNSILARLGWAGPRGASWTPSKDGPAPFCPKLAPISPPMAKIHPGKGSSHAIPSGDPPPS